MSTTSSTLPLEWVVRRLSRDLAEQDRLLALLEAVADGYVLTNRLDEALVLVPADVMAEINRTLGRPQ